MAKPALGLVGGLGPDATILYYKLLNARCLEYCGSRPRVAIYSIPLEEMCGAVKAGDLDRVALLLAEALEALAAAGAVVAGVAANTPHIAWERIRGLASRLRVRLVHIADAAVEAVKGAGAAKVGLLATGSTVAHGFYQERLLGAGVEVVTPPQSLQERVDRAIEKIAAGAGEEALEPIVEAARWLASRADAILVACTDISPYVEALRLRASLGKTAVIDSSAAHVEELAKTYAGLHGRGRIEAG